MAAGEDSFRDRQAAETIAAALQEKGIVFPPEAAAALESGNLIAAIKFMREANPGLGLKEAKQAVEGVSHVRSKTGADRAHDALGNDVRRVPTVVEGDRGGYRSLLVVVFIALAMAVWWLFAGGN